MQMTQALFQGVAAARTTEVSENSCISRQRIPPNQLLRIRSILPPETRRLHCPRQSSSVFAVPRPVDAVIEFLRAEQARGVNHVLLDEGARDGLRELYIRAAKSIRPAAKGNAATLAPATPAPAPANLTSGSGSKAERLASLRRQAENWQPARALGTLRETMVFATGNPDASIVLVGEAPGYQEEKEREPFVGPAGQKLNEILKAMGIARDEVYISNIVKFRPATPRQTTNNRKPTTEEMASCLPFIREELAIIRPACVIALGGTAAEGLLGLNGSVTSMRGQWHDFDGIPTRVTYHPSYLLQSGGNNSVKRQVWEDMLAVMEQLGMPISEKQRGFFLPKG
jgi:DNA polymerase